MQMAVLAQHASYMLAIALLSSLCRQPLSKVKDAKSPLLKSRAISEQTPKSTRSSAKKTSTYQ